MNKEAILEKFNQLGNAEGILEKMNQTNSKEEIVNVFNEYGWMISADEFEKEVFPVIQTLVEENEELAEKTLENVSGGCPGFVFVAGTALVAAAVYKYKLAKSKK